MQQHPVHPDAPPEDLIRVTEVLRALGDPTRLQIVLLLCQHERNVTQLVTALKQPQSTISRHLAQLRAARLVRTRRDANSVHYRLADAHLVTLVHEAFSHAQHERLKLPDHPHAATEDAR